MHLLHVQLPVAVAVERGMGARAWLAAALLECARARLSRNDEGDRNTARLELAEAAGIVDESDLGGLRSSVRDLTTRVAG